MSTEVLVALALLTAPAPTPPPKLPPPVPVIRAPKKLPVAMHTHRCPRDGTEISHTHASFGDAEAHRCPKCGQVVFGHIVRHWTAHPSAGVPADPPPAGTPAGWVTPHSVVALPCPPGRP